MQPAGGLWASLGEQKHGINYGKLEGEPELQNLIQMYNNIVAVMAF